MAAARPPGRRRAQVSGRYFALSWERPSSDAPAMAATPAAPAPAPAPTGRPMIAVAKKLVPSSPLRNAIRRVVREAARARPGPPPPALLERLVALPTGDAPAPAPASKRGRPSRPFDRRLTDRALKRACRADLDALLAQAAERLVRDLPRRPAP